MSQEFNSKKPLFVLNDSPAGIQTVGRAKWEQSVLTHLGLRSRNEGNTWLGPNLWDEREDMKEESGCKERSDLHMEFKVEMLEWQMSLKSN